MSKCIILKNVPVEENINKIIIDFEFNDFEILKYSKSGYKIRFPSNQIAINFLDKIKDTKYSGYLCKIKIKLCNDLNCVLPDYMDHFDEDDFVLHPPQKVCNFLINNNIKLIECKFFTCYKCKFDSHHFNKDKTILFTHIPKDNI